MDDWDLISEAAKMVMDAFKRKSPNPSPKLDIKNKHDFEVFLGSLMGAIEAIGIITEKEDNKTHNLIINALEKLAYR
jgi:hypothetical protein